MVRFGPQRRLPEGAHKLLTVIRAAGMIVQPAVPLISVSNNFSKWFSLEGSGSGEPKIRFRVEPCAPGLRRHRFFGRDTQHSGQPQKSDALLKSKVTSILLIPSTARPLGQMPDFLPPGATGRQALCFGAFFRLRRATEEASLLFLGPLRPPTRQQRAPRTRYEGI